MKDSASRLASSIGKSTITAAVAVILLGLSLTCENANAARLLLGFGADYSQLELPAPQGGASRPFVAQDSSAIFAFRFRLLERATGEWVSISMEATSFSF
jgi:hypothetical protein